FMVAGPYSELKNYYLEVSLNQIPLSFQCKVALQYLSSTTAHELEQIWPFSVNSGFFNAGTKINSNGMNIQEPTVSRLG
ncbi:MAG: hypothetical protein ACXV8J_10835, partial [Methylobacter sp.]